MSASALDWDDLRIVLAIAEHGTISGAAGSLRLSHPTLSRRLRLIEQRLGTRLFDRTPLACRLTAAGEEARQVALQMREHVTALERRIAGRDRQPAGPIRLTAPDAVAEYLLPPILAEMYRRSPDVTVELIVSNQVLSLAQRAADIALRVTDRPDPSLRGRRVGTVAMAIYATPALSMHDVDIAAAPWVGFDAGLACSGPGQWIAEHISEANIRFRANTLLGAAQAVRSGMGLGLLPCFVGGSIPGLVRLGAPLPELSTGLWLLTHSDMTQVPRLKAASSALASRLKAAAPLLTGSETDSASSPALVRSSDATGESRAWRDSA